MRIQVFGPGCAKCKQLHENVSTAVQDLGLDVEVEKVSGLHPSIISRPAWGSPAREEPSALGRAARERSLGACAYAWPPPPPPA